MTDPFSPDNGSGLVPAIAWQDHERWLRTLAVARVGSTDAAEELLQNVAMAWLIAQQRRIAIDRIGPWLYRVMVRQCLQYRRQQGRRRNFESRWREAQSDEERCPDSNPLGWLLSDERQSHVRNALDQLRPSDAQVLILKYTENWTYVQIAERLGVTVATIESRLHRARRRMREYLHAWQEEASKS